jgi:RNA polymerase sigma-70 factor, ECF subfamily
MAWEVETVSDEELARQSQAGSLCAFEKLVYRYEGRIHRFVATLCRNETDAREITQDAFVRAFQAIAQFNLKKKFAPWLFTIARHKCVDYHRATSPVAEEPLPDQADHEDPASQLSRKEEQASVWTLAQQHLSSAQFEALWLRYAEEMSVEEIAQVLRKTKTHIKVLLFRARTNLRHQLDAIENPPDSSRKKHAILSPPTNTQLKRSNLGLV